jgi:CRISPR/Cas system CSM-associated protein Csm3 (group 7 of RAMP superfamily)
LKVSQGNTNIHTKTVAVDFCTRIKVIAKCLAEYQSKACEDTLIFNDTGASQFEPLQLPKDVLTIENNDICRMFTDDACTTNADNQRDYSEMTYSDVSYTRVKTDVQTKSTDAKDKAKTRVLANERVLIAPGWVVLQGEKKWTWRVVPTK